MDDARWQQCRRCRSRRNGAGGTSSGAEQVELVCDRAHPFALRSLLGCAGVAPALFGAGVRAGSQ